MIGQLVQLLDQTNPVLVLGQIESSSEVPAETNFPDQSFPSSSCSLDTSGGLDLSGCPCRYAVNKLLSIVIRVSGMDTLSGGNEGRM